MTKPKTYEEEHRKLRGKEPNFANYDTEELAGALMVKMADADDYDPSDKVAAQRSKLAKAKLQEARDAMLMAIDYMEGFQ